jgi:molybdenum storage protein
MTRLATGDGRIHIESSLMRESLVNRAVAARTDSEHELAILPHVKMVSIGGQSIFDRGKDAVLPVIDEIAAIRASRTQPMVLCVGGGTRTRHTVSIAVDLGLPLGGIAQLVGAMEEANAVFANALLAKSGSIVMQREHFWELPLYLESGMMPICISIPPYHFWEPPTESPLPAHGSDFGAFEHAEVLGMQHIVFVKDEDGLYDKDPKKHADAKFIAKTTLDELRAMNLPEMILDYTLFDAWAAARHIQKVQIVNGLKPGLLTRALAGEDVGTVITKSGTKDGTKGERQ